MKTHSALVLLLSSSLAIATPLTTPHTFSEGAPDLASEVNENFVAHQEAINAIPRTLTPVLYVCSGLMIPDTLMGSKLLPDTEVFHNDQQKKLFHRVQARDRVSGAGSGLQHTGSL